MGRWRGAVAGVVAAGAALGVAEVVAVPVGPRSAPLIAVGGVVVDAVPEPVKAAAIAAFGVHDKTALLVGTLVLLVLAAAGIGVLALRSLRYALAGVAGFAAAGVAAALTRPGATVLYALPTLVGALAAVGVAVLLLRPARVAVPAGPDPGWDVDLAPPAAFDRRRFLGLAGGAVAVAALAGAAGRWLGSQRAVEAARALVRLPRPAAPAAPLPAGAQLAVPGLSSFTTANRDFYRIDTALVVPQVDPGEWRLRVHGRVAKEFELTFAQLLERPMIERDITLACVSNEVGGDLIGTARWLGVRVADLLAEAGVDPAADQTVARAVDGWTCGTPTAVLRDGRDALLAVGMNGEPLPVEHGFPVRMVVPGLYGYVSACKWITELELTTFAAFDAYWVPRGWSALGPIKTQSRIDVPRDGARVPPGEAVIAGVAWAQHRGIDRVEVRVDDGPWQDAALAVEPTPDTWRQWSLRWTATPGSHTVTVRATDRTGATQTAAEADVVPDGATGHHRIRVDVR
ncbi:molybdopterin-dependent oxidoreductase [Spirilliplanes yamanashiensis]|uniref:Oxidoreductase n=1 Tax=Spirilliplanes yamanashiensis TaxID=42233 RepID=A0A8J3Y8Z7_9ACTN|nr:molybdopterin-dependent oxidoreductase [Spirilliplanes yamanashiensis]MDP9815949.1 DMSO/TMAO reductase YedYZ molybdopterin-dependent catalytic subunit [Spirilliplanes yamanashiensis]GIJ04206.1 oxidoreductase [Spirilliplanes yamanashiensis]